MSGKEVGKPLRGNKCPNCNKRMYVVAWGERRGEQDCPTKYKGCGYSSRPIQ